MTIEELRISVGAPSVDALKECLPECGLTLDKCQDVSVRGELRMYFATYCGYEQLKGEIASVLAQARNT